MARSKTVEVAGEKAVVREKKIGELETLAQKLFEDAASLGITETTGVGDALKLGTGLLYSKAEEIFGLKPETVKEAYPSEIEALVEAFVDVNFFGLKKLGGSLLQVAQTARSLPRS